MFPFQVESSKRDQGSEEHPGTECETPFEFDGTPQSQDAIGQEQNTVDHSHNEIGLRDLHLILEGHSDCKKQVAHSFQYSDLAKSLDQ